MDIPHLEQKLSAQITSNNAQLIRKLKFQNLIYEVGDNIRVRSDISSAKDLYAKILSIVQVKNITTFPLIEVAWYEDSDNQLIASFSSQELSSKELILTQSKDWQYIEAVKGKIQVFSEKEFMEKDPKEQEKDDIFFCRSFFTKNKELIIDAKKRCFCQNIYRPENPLIMCQICQVLFHPQCSNGRQDRCIKCIW